MKKLFLLAAILLFAFVKGQALDPVRVAILYTSGSSTNIEVELYDYSTSSTIYTETIGNLTANSSGIITFIVGDGFPSWTNVNSSTINGNSVINVKTGTPATLYAQYRLDALILVQAQTGSGIAMTGGAGAFTSSGGKTTAVSPTDDFIFGDDDFNWTIGTEYKMFFDNGTGAFRAGTVDGSQWNDGNRGNYSTAMGYNSTASGNYSTSIGSNNIASGSRSLAMGDFSEASGDYSIAMGQSNTASGANSTALGIATTASGFRSTAIGESTIASGSQSTATGNSTTASGNNSFAMGINTVASNWSSFAGGYSTNASGQYSVALGRFNVASGFSSTALSASNTASGDYSTAMGFSTTAKSYGETAIGLYNTDYTPNSTSSWNSTDRLFVVGNGTGAGSRSDAMVVLKNGNTTVGGDLSVTGTTSYSTGTAIGDLANVITFNSGGASITTADLNANHPNGTVLYLHETSGTGDITDGDGTGISFSFQNIVMVKDGTGTWRIMSFAQ